MRTYVRTRPSAQDANERVLYGCCARSPLSHPHYGVPPLLASQPFGDLLFKRLNGGGPQQRRLPGGGGGGLGSD